MLDAYLRDLESELAKRLPPEDVRARLAEAEAHLRDGTDGRLELGLSLEEAEREAVASFGAARTLGQAMRTREPLVDFRFLLVSAAVVGYWLTFGYGRSFPDWSLIPVVVSYLAFHGAFLLRSAKVQRPQIVAFLLVFIPIWLSLAVPRGLDEADFVRDNLAGARAQVATEWTALTRKHEALEGACVRFANGKDARSPSRIPTYETDGQVRLFDRADREAAARHWSEAMTNGAYAMRMQAETLGEREEEQNALAHTTKLGFIVRAMGSVFATVGWGPALFYFASHLAAWFLGFALRRYRRRRRDGGLRA